MNTLTATTAELYELGVSAGVSLLYIGIALVQGHRLLHGQGLDRWSAPLLSLLALGMVGHGWLLSEQVMLASGLDFGLFKTLSMVAWLFVVWVWAAGWRRSTQGLALVILPCAAVAVVLAHWLPSQYSPRADLAWGLELHILLSVFSYTVLSLALGHAVLMVVQNAGLRPHGTAAAKPFSACSRHLALLLPPVLSMDQRLFQLIGLGFVSLSAAIVCGFVYVDDWMAQHLAHKTLLTLLAWCVFAILLIGRYRLGWRGVTAATGTAIGCAILMIAFIGSKFVLEWVLHRI